MRFSIGRQWELGSDGSFLDASAANIRGRASYKQ